MECHHWNGGNRWGLYQSRFLWLFSAGAALVFWVLEGLWKSFQYMYAPRIKLLEEAFRNDEFEGLAPFQVYSSWFTHLQDNGFQLVRNMFLGLVAFPHAVTVITGLSLFLVEALGGLTIPRKS